MGHGISDFENVPDEDNPTLRKLMEAIKTIKENEKMAEKELEKMKKTAKEKEEKIWKMLEEGRRAEEEREEEARKVLEQAEKDLRDGIQRKILPTEEEIETAKANIKYQNEKLHFAVCGTGGSGKSSLINAIRGIPNGTANAAETGTDETTVQIGRFPDHHTDSRSRFVWYDIPGAGTITIPGWQYFINQGLYIFDFIIVVIGDRITDIDLEIIKNCWRFDIPSFIVRSKANQYIKNIKNDMKAARDQDTPESSGCEGKSDDRTSKTLYELARDKFVSGTRKTVAENLQKANLPDQRVYIISKDTIYRLVIDKDRTDRTSVLNLMSRRDRAKEIDEENLLHDMLGAAYDRRYTNRTVLPPGDDCDP